MDAAGDVFVDWCNAAGGIHGRQIVLHKYDAAVLNFALNLEYLEAEFYQYAAFGTGLSGGLTNGKGKHGGVTGGRQVAFATPAIVRRN